MSACSSIFLSVKNVYSLRVEKGRAAVSVVVMMKGLSKCLSGGEWWLTGTERDCSFVCCLNNGRHWFDFDDWSLIRSVHGFATKDHSMWEFHCSFCYGREIPYRSSCYGSCFHCCWPSWSSLTRCHCTGHTPISLLFPL